MTVDTVTLTGAGQTATVSGKTFDRMAGLGGDRLRDMVNGRDRGDDETDDGAEPDPSPLGRNPDGIAFVPADDDFGDDAFIRVGQKVEALARAIQIKHRLNVRFAVEYRWKREGGEEGGRPVFGACVNLGGAARHFAGADFLVWVAADWTRQHRITNRQFEALLHHQLTHVSETDKGKPSIRPHDFAGFREELVRYGLWTDDLCDAAPAFEQAALL